MHQDEIQRPDPLAATLSDIGSGICEPLVTTQADHFATLFPHFGTAIIAAIPLDTLRALRLAIREALSPWLADLGFGYVDKGLQSWQYSFDPVVVFYIRFNLIERICGLTAGSTPEETARARVSG